MKVSTEPKDKLCGQKDGIDKGQGGVSFYSAQKLT